MIINKSTVKKALKTEPLKSGMFFQFSYGDEMNTKNCSVCAVGAVIRTHLKKQVKKYNLSLLCDYGSEITKYRNRGITLLDRELKCKNYLGALSIYYEYHSNVYDDKELRNVCIEFVTKHFPTRFKVLDIEDLNE